MRYALIATTILVACAGLAKAEIANTVKWAPIAPSPLWDRSGIPKWKPAAPIVNATLSVTKPTAPQPQKPIPDRRNLALLPPVEYDNAYTGAWYIQTVDSQEAVRKNCPGATFSHGYALACKRQTGKTCLIIMAKPDIIKAEGFTDAIVMRHEMGHCAGWSGDHAGARVPTAADWAEK